MASTDHRDHAEETYQQAHCDACGTSPCQWDGRTPDGFHDAPAEPAANCGRCGNPFDRDDVAFDGRAEYNESGFCCGCVDRCHESTDFDHACVICDPTRR